MSTNQIPVSILTGFLGSGKTTLLNHLLLNRQEKKFAVIENEFANYAFDSYLIDNRVSVLNTISSGCICCSKSSELLETLQKMVDVKENFNHLIIESTGVSDPSQIIFTLFNEDFFIDYYIDAVICTVDVIHIDQFLLNTKEAAKQIGYADVILLTKTDSVSQEKTHNVFEMMKQINPLASIYISSHGFVADADILNLKAFIPSNVEKKIIDMKILDNGENKVQHRIKSMCFDFDISFNFFALKGMLETISDIYGKNLFRIKGFIHVNDFSERMIIQSVADTHVFQKGRKWDSFEKPITKLVFIGKELQRDLIQGLLERCLSNAYH
ncbi:MAG: GTP-binding protein [Bacteroidetes bacterium]|nr:GTP-binding protein [Bacteroidota bacterium]